MCVDSGVKSHRLVKTHNCLCGQKCGIKLRVEEEEVVEDAPTGTCVSIQWLRWRRRGMLAGLHAGPTGAKRDGFLRGPAIYSF